MQWRRVKIIRRVQVRSMLDEQTGDGVATCLRRQMQWRTMFMIAGVHVRSLIAESQGDGSAILIVIGGPMQWRAPARVRQIQLGSAGHQHSSNLRVASGRM